MTEGLKPGPLTYEPGVWYDWSGGENPVPGRVVEWRNRCGDSETCDADELEGWGHPHVSGATYDIIAFRLVSESPALPLGEGKGSSADADTHRSADGAVVGYEDPDHAPRSHVPDMERLAYNQMPKAGWRELKLFRYDGTVLYQWFGKKGLNSDARDWSVFEDAASDPFQIAERQSTLAPEQPSPSVPTEGHGTGVVGWQPIETAPKDGSEFLFAWTDDDGVSVRIGFWCKRRGCVDWESSLWPQKDQPTHWMPLPPPPAASVSMGTSRKASEPIPPVEGVNAELLGALESVKWRSACRDNMEFEARITYVQMDAIRTAIATATRNSGDEG